MTEHDDVNGELQQRLASLELALRPQGVLGEIAQSVVSNGHELEPAEVVDVLLPPKKEGDAYQARWQLVEGAPDALKQAVGERAEEVFDLAEKLGMRRPEAVSDAELERISTNAVWTIEGGANRTSVVRRAIILEAMLRKYGPEGVEEQTVYQFGSDRPIPRERDGKPNPEYTIAQEIAGDYLPEDDTLTEFKLNLLAALQDGYVITLHNDDASYAINQLVILHKDGYPALRMIEPVKDRGGLMDGFSAVAQLEGSMEGRQFVVGTNGQYRPKDELQARQWAADIDMIPAVALGDEPGFEVEHNGRTITTADRNAAAYMNEMIILHRLSLQ